MFCKHIYRYSLPANEVIIIVNKLANPLNRTISRLVEINPRGVTPATTLMIVPIKVRFRFKDDGSDSIRRFKYRNLYSRALNNEFSVDRITNIDIVGRRH